MQSINIPGRPFRGPDAPRKAFRHLERFCGLEPKVASNRLHKIKARAQLSATDDVIIGRTGDVYMQQPVSILEVSPTNHSEPKGSTLRKTTMNSKNAKFNHVFAIIRLDTFQEGASVEEKMTIPKVVLTQETAEKEVERLNALNGSKGAFYFWQMTRLEICPDNSLTTCSEN